MYGSTLPLLFYSLSPFLLILPYFDSNLFLFFLVSLPLDFPPSFFSLPSSSLHFLSFILPSLPYNALFILPPFLFLFFFSFFCLCLSPVFTFVPVKILRVIHTSKHLSNSIQKLSLYYPTVFLPSIISFLLNSLHSK